MVPVVASRLEGLAIQPLRADLPGSYDLDFGTPNSWCRHQDYCARCGKYRSYQAIERSMLSTRCLGSRKP